MVGLTPLFAVQVLDPDLLDRVPEFRQRLEWVLNYRPDLTSLVSRWFEYGKGEPRLLSLLRGHRIKRLLKRMLDETESSSPTPSARCRATTSTTRTCSRPAANGLP